jgi:hypothetical protein
VSTLLGFDLVWWYTKPTIHICCWTDLYTKFSSLMTFVFYCHLTYV